MEQSTIINCNITPNISKQYWEEVSRVFKAIKNQEFEYKNSPNYMEIEKKALLMALLKYSNDLMRSYCVNVVNFMMPQNGYTEGDFGYICPHCNKLTDYINPLDRLISGIPEKFGNRVVLRKSKSGRFFWGCENFPECKFTYPTMEEYNKREFERNIVLECQGERDDW